MRRDPTVWISLVMLVVPWGISLATFQSIDSAGPPLDRALFWTMFIGGVRAAILWYQTLIHGLRHARRENLVAVVLAHLFLGPVMAYAYYLSSRMDIRRGAQPKAPLAEPFEPPVGPITDGDAVVVATEAPTEHQATAIAAAMEEEGIRSELSGMLTCDFRADAPGRVQILVHAADLARARQIAGEWWGRSHSDHEGTAESS
jgi:hypothetical protein